VIRRHSQATWERIQRGTGGPEVLIERLTTDPEILSTLPQDTVRTFLDASDYTGDAPQRARRLAINLRTKLTKQMEQTP
jgi:hypothetical protein